MNNIKKGFIAPVIDKTHWFLGSSPIPFKELQSDSNWELDLPIIEKQNIRNIETFNCTGFNTLNAIEILMLKLYGERPNYSDRWLGIIAGTKEPGNDPQVVSEAIRKYGLIPESMLPFSDDIKNVDEYYSFKGLTQAEIDACYAEGEKWKATYVFLHDWVFSPGQPILEQKNNIKIALKTSPLCIAVYAWASDARDVYISMGQENHWTCVYNEDDFLRVFDSYEPFKKMVEQNLMYCKRYYIALKDPISPEQAKGFWDIVADLWKKIFNIQKKIEELPKPTPEPIPTSITPPSKYLWDTDDQIYHSIRLIADEEGLTVLQKDLACDIAHCESGTPERRYNIKIRGKIDPRDRGLFQWNSHFHPEITDEVAFDPEKNVRLGCKAIKQGKAHAFWSASQACWNKSGKYNSLVI